MLYLLTLGIGLFIGGIVGAVVLAPSICTHDINRYCSGYDSNPDKD